MTSRPQPLDDRVIAFIRATLALTALLFTYIDPTGPRDLIGAVYATLALYCLYSVALYAATLRRAAFVSAGIAHWVDIGWYVLLVAISGGSNSAYFLLFFFPILVASFRHGLSAGLMVAALSAALFTLVGYSALTVNEFELSRFVLRPVYLLVLGYLIAFWGSQELKLRRQLELLKDVTLTLNPRFGTHHLVSHVVRVLCEFYGARLCLLLHDEGPAGTSLLFRAGAGGATPAERAPAESFRRLLPATGDVLLFAGRRRGLLRGGWKSFDPSTGAPTAVPRETFAAAAAALEAETFLSVPVSYRPGTDGRLYVADPAKPLGRSDADFIAHVFEHIRPFVENVRLVDSLASGAAREERQKIARDIHDSVIQPYIGLQLGLEALRRQAGPHGEMERGLERLLRLTESGIEDLREYVGELREGGGPRRGRLLPGLRRFGEKFSEATGITVRVECETPDLFVNDRLADEVFQMATEALSNVRRHTEAKAATVRVACDNRRLSLRVANDGPAGDNGAAFVPRSISERAESLGGTFSVRRPPEGGAVVEVDIPL